MRAGLGGKSRAPPLGVKTRRQAEARHHRVMVLLVERRFDPAPVVTPVDAVPQLRQGPAKPLTQRVFVCGQQGVHAGIV